MDDYTELGISPDSDDGQIRNAYIRLARKYHPDNGEQGDEEALKRINTAYDNIRRDREEKERLPEISLSPKHRRSRRITVSSVVIGTILFYILLRILLKLFF